MKRASCLLLVLAFAARPGAAVEINRIVLRVNDRIATLFDYQVRRAKQVQFIRGSVTDPQARQEQLATVGEDVLRQMFDEMLLLSRADQLGLSPSETSLEEAMAAMREAAGIKDADEFRLALQQSGMTLEEFRQQTLDNLLMRSVMSQEVQPRVSLDEEDLRRYYRAHPEEFTVPAQRHLEEVVLLDESGLETAKLEGMAEAIRSALEAGGAMSEIVAPFVEKGLASGVIDLGSVGRRDLDPALSAAVWDLPAGAVSEPVRGRGGLHVVHVLERQDAILQPFAEVAQAIDERLRRQRFDDAIQEYFEELENSSYLVIDAPPEAAGFRTRTQGRSRRGVIQGLDDLSRPGSEEPPAAPPDEGATPP